MTKATGPNPAESLDVIAVGAHPDDVEIACGGTLARLARWGYRVGIADLTDGEPTPRSPGPEVRLAEARLAAQTLGVQVRETLALPNRRLFDSFEARVALARLFRRFRPKVVLGLAGRTVLASPDHYQAMLITDAAVFYSRLSKWDEYFDGLPIHAVTSQLHYSLALRSLERPDAAGCFVSNISDTLELKLAAIRAYQSQFPPEKEAVFRLIESANRHYGQMAGFEAGELFWTHRAIGTDDLMRVASPAHAREGPELKTEPFAR
jgi:LmbE family N-acetylglucosaminyl deacetylase